VKNVKVRKLFSGHQYTLHFVFVKSVHRRARKGLDDAFLVELPYLVSLL
jgi:hypothetical protein